MLIEDNSNSMMLPDELLAGVIEPQKLILESRARVLKAITRNIEYPVSLDSSDSYLRNHIRARVRIVVLYVDLIGSTNMSVMLPIDTFTKIIQTFAQEMAIIILLNQGYVLKYVGDAVIAYFPSETDIEQSCHRAVNCARNMLMVVEQSINPILKENNYPELSVKIGIDAGENAVVQYGSDGATSHVDLLGHTMSLTAKITAMAQPNHILMGDMAYKCVNLYMRKKLTQYSLQAFDYIDHQTGDAYRLYSLSS